LCGRVPSDAAVKSDRIRVAAGAEGIERLEAHLQGQAFAPHRHDTYAIGITLSGVQTFRFRGERWRCLPGQCHILHPDETHDGAAGTDEGFGYSIIYLEPWCVQQALGCRPLPFVGSPVVEAARLPPGFASEVWDIDEDIDDLARSEIILAVATLLVEVSSGCLNKPEPIAIIGLTRVRYLIAGCPAEQHSAAELERAAGLDRWTLARQFRAAFGTSPSRFRTMRRLCNVRRLLRDGATLAQASVEAGFADQSHMSRRFKSAYGLTPGHWLAALARSRGASAGLGSNPR
jgi:AraC-like DNA-binding protein